MKRNLLKVLLATTAVAGAPLAALVLLRLSGVLSSPFEGVAVMVALTFLLAQAGAAYWQRRPSSRDLLFNELMLWGFVHRLYNNRRLANARKLLGELSDDGSQVDPQRRIELLEELAQRLDRRDPLTHGHSRRVARHAWMIAKRMNLPSEEVSRVRTAAAIHDVGKLFTPIEILRKPAQLSDEEFEVIKRHPVDGAELALPLGDPELVAIIRHHHERLDGSGYPDHLCGEEIPLGARIIAVADTFDAITSQRPYRSPRSHKQALDILRAEAGTRLDAGAVRAFCSHYSGRRPLLAWLAGAVASEAVLARLGEALFGFAAPVKLAAVAAVVIAGAVLSVAPPLVHRAGRPLAGSLRVHLTAHAQRQVAGRAYAASRQRFPLAGRATPGRRDPTATATASRVRRGGELQRTAVALDSAAASTPIRVQATTTSSTTTQLANEPAGSGQATAAQPADGSARSTERSVSHTKPSSGGAPQPTVEERPSVPSLPTRAGTAKGNSEDHLAPQQPATAGLEHRPSQPAGGSTNESAAPQAKSNQSETAVQGSQRLQSVVAAGSATKEAAGRSQDEAAGKRG